MATVFVEFKQNYVMPTGGMAGTGEIASFDPATAATLIAAGIAVSSSAPSAPTPIVLTRVKLTGKFGDLRIGHSPLYNAGEIAGFPAAIAAALIAAGHAVAN
jgi:hypothetical protein